MSYKDLPRRKTPTTEDTRICSGRGWKDPQQELAARIGAEASEQGLCPFCLRPLTECTFGNTDPNRENGYPHCNSGNPPVSDAEAVAKLWRYDRG